MSLKAGCARVDISPQKPLFLVGYPHVQRTSTGIHDPLYASAVCLDNGDTAVLLIAVDILIVPREVARKCRETLSTATGIPREHILISATHTHSGPVTRSVLAWRADPVVPPVDDEYLEHFIQGIIQAGLDARDGVVPAEVAVTRADARGVGGNRLEKDGVCDPEVGLLFGREASDGTPIFLLMVYSMHPTVLHEDSKLVSSDFPGFACGRLEEQLPGVMASFHMGTSGNQSPRYFVSGQTFEEAERLGHRLAGRVVRAVRSLGAADFAADMALGGVSERLTLPRKTFPPLDEAKAWLEEAVATFDRLKEEGAGHGPVRTAECAVFGAEEGVVLAEAQASGEIDEWYRQCESAEVQVLRVGDAHFVGLPGEFFVEYGLEIKERVEGSAFVITMVSGDLQGYVVTPEAYAAGGYEASLGFFPPEAGRMMADTGVALAERLRGA